MPILYKYTGGVPRLINTLCDTALTVAYADNLPTVTLQVVKEAIDELQWQPFDRRSSARRGRAGGKPERAAGAQGDAERVLGNIGQRLNQVDSLIPSLSTIADRMASIEALLRGIAEAIASRNAEHEVPARKAGGGKDR
jgi:hypothetical protein